MEKQSVEDMFDSLWFGYPTDLCRNKRGGKQPAMKAWKKVMPKADSDEFFRIMENMKAQVRADRKDPDAYRWPFVSTFLNQRRFDDTVASESERVSKEALKTCSIEGCDEPCHGSKFSKCSRHLPNNFDDELRDAWAKTGLNRKSPTLADDCRDYCKSRGYLL